MTVRDHRVSHAQLFFGPAESEKLALAIAYSQFINCNAPKSPEGDLFRYADIKSPSGDLGADSCGTCPSCIKYQKLIHPDLHFIFPVSTTKKVTKKPQSKLFMQEWRTYLLERNTHIDLQGWYDQIGIENKQGIINADDCNDIITTLSYKSYESEYKVMIIWMVEKLYHSAAPKILKILEEPPDKTLFLLISEDPDQIISTILSRCLMVRIPPPDGAHSAVDSDDPWFFTTFRNWMLDCYGGKVIKLTGFASEMGKAGREKQKALLQYGLKTLEFCTAVQFKPETILNQEAKEAEFIQKFSSHITLSNLPFFATLFNTAIYHVERNAYGPALFLDISLRIARHFNVNFIHL